MNEAQAHEAIMQRWNDQWTALRPTVPFTFTNEIFASADEWVRVTIVPATSRQSALGAVTRWTRAGTIGVQIYTPANAGTKRASQFADDVRTIFEGQMLYLGNDQDPVVTLGGASGSPVSDGKWLSVLVTIPYAFDQQKGAITPETFVNLNTQNFRYTVAAVAASYTIPLPAARADANYRVDWSIADGTYTVGGQTPIADRTTAQFVLVPDAPLSIGDVLEFTVEDLT